MSLFRKGLHVRAWFFQVQHGQTASANLPQLLFSLNLYDNKTSIYTLKIKVSVCLCVLNGTTNMNTKNSE